MISFSALKFTWCSGSDVLAQWTVLFTALRYLHRRHHRIRIDAAVRRHFHLMCPVWIDHPDVQQGTAGDRFGFHKEDLVQSFVPGDAVPLDELGNACQLFSVRSVEVHREEFIIRSVGTAEIHDHFSVGRDDGGIRILRRV